MDIPGCYELDREHQPSMDHDLCSSLALCTTVNAVCLRLNAVTCADTAAREQSVSMLPRSLLLPTDISGVRMTSCDRLAPGWVISGSAELKLLSGDGRLHLYFPTSVGQPQACSLPLTLPLE